MHDPRCDEILRVIAPYRFNPDEKPPKKNPAALSFPLTSQQFAKQGGTICPACGSRKLVRDTMLTDVKQAWGTIRCHECDCEFVAVYRLIGYETGEGDCQDLTGKQVILT